MVNNPQKPLTSEVQEVNPVASITEPPQEEIKSNSSRKKILISLSVLLGFLLFGLVGYYLGIQIKEEASNSQPSTIKSTDTFEITPSVLPNKYLEDISKGGTKVSYAISSDKVLIKISINLKDSVFKYPNSELRTIERIYSQDSPHYDPRELKDVNVLDYSWTDLVSRKMENTTNARSILVSDHLFSFKQIPNGNGFLFVIEWSKNASDSEAGPHFPIENERVLYFFGGNNEVIKVMTFDKDSHQYTYPKIDLISEDGRYVSLKLFGCWGCGGHQPETLLVDLQSLKSSNIGKVLEFEWTRNGEYQYKDYIVIECDESGPGECRQDPNTLPLRTGSIN